MKKIFTFILILSCYASFAQLNIQFRANLSYGSLTLANIGGYVDHSGHEYALVGYQSGLDIVDVTNPAAPVVKFTATGPNSEWREVKVYRDYAYVTTEAGSSGLQIVDLSQLPASINKMTWKGDSTILNQINTIHALHIDTAKAMLYLYGSNISSGANNNGYPLIIDISKPLLPHFVGRFIISSGNAYVHDGYVENDTAYFGHIYGGFVSIVDVRDKKNPKLLATQVTPGAFTHNVWLSANHKVMFTTDEVTNSYLTAYDISDLSNISELSRFQKDPGSNSIVHNTHILNGYAVTSWYTEGVVITDVSRPANPVEVGFYDTYPANNSGNFNGDWGVYPFLPSGNLVCSDINNGLFVLAPTYIRGCYLEGVVSDSITGTPISTAAVQMTTPTINKSTDIIGQYKMGTVTPGTYIVQVSKAGYVTKTITGVLLNNGVLTTLDVKLAHVSIQPKAYFITGTHPTCDGFVQFTDTSTNLPNSWKWNFGDDSTSTLQNPSHIYAANGTYTVTLTVTNPYGTDSTKQTILINVTVPTPTTISATACIGNTAILVATSPKDIYWFSSATGGMPIATGTSFVTPALTATTTYYVESQVLPAAQKEGAPNDSIGGGGYFTTSGYHTLYFDCPAPITIVSVKVYAQGGGDRTITLMQNAATLQSITVNIPDGTSRVTLNFPVPAGTNFELGLQGNTSLYRNTSGASFPMTVNGLVSITGTDAGGGYYYYFYDWIVQGPPCVSPRVPVTATVLPSTAGFTDSIIGLAATFTNTSTDGIFYLWNFGDPASGANDTSTSVNPVHVFSGLGTFNVCLTTITASGCVMKTCSQITSDATGIEGIANQIHASFYPNPFNHSVQISIEGNETFSKGSLVITDLAGRIVSIYEVRNHSTLTLGNELSAGVYFARIITSGNNSSAIMKLVKSE